MSERLDTELVNRGLAESRERAKSYIMEGIVYVDNQKALKAGDKVQLVGFGTFEAKVRAAHIGRNPATGAEIKIPASKAPAFKAGKTFKDSVQ